MIRTGTPLAWLEAQARRSIAIVVLVDSIDISRRDMPRAQLLRGQVPPYVDIDAVPVGDTEEALRPAHHRPYAPAGGVDQMDAGHQRHIGIWHSLDGIGASGRAQPSLKTAIANRVILVASDIPWGSRNDKCRRFRQERGHVCDTPSCGRLRRMCRPPGTHARGGRPDPPCRYRHRC